MTNPPPISGLKDNHRRGKVGDFLDAKILPDAQLSFVSAYFTLHAYHALRSALERAKSLRFLFGEPRFVGAMDRDEKAAREFRLTEKGLSLGNQLAQKKLAKECADWIERKVEIRSVTRTGFLHGKMYHVQDGKVAHAVLGSSNFTVPGLGLLPVGNNIELNLVVTDDWDRDDLLVWFNELWDDKSLVEDVKGRVLAELARLYGNKSPQFIYYLTLFHLFGDFLKQDREAELQLDKTNFFDSLVWKKLYSFQRDGVRGAIRKLLDYNGCILADSVGLGKTFEALAVIKYFESVKGARVLVLCPKKGIYILDSMDLMV